MKALVDAIQLLVVAALIYPMFYIWNVNKVDQFCSEIEVGGSRQEFLKTADELSVKIATSPDFEMRGRWNASSVTWLPFTNHSCKVTGYGGKVSSARIDKV